jgi:uncharacterized protein YcbX
MRGESLDSAELGWHGIDGDRRFGLRRIGERGDFPWLSASRLPEMVLFSPRDGHVRTPDGRTLPMLSTELADEIASRFGAPVEMMQMRHGIFDDAPISVIACETVSGICRLAGVNEDVRRFRPNILIRTSNAGAFQEDRWIGRTLSFGEDVAIAVTAPDVRCSMLNIDPDTAALTTEVMKAVVRANNNNAGVYCTVIRAGRLSVGQPVYLK